MSLPTLSRIPLAMACIGSQVLPAIESESGVEAAGTAKHDYSGALLSGRSPDEALEAVPEEHREGVEAVPWDIILPRLAGLTVEAAYAYDPRKRTTRRLGAQLARRYNQAPEEIAGALDYSAEAPAIYVDLKTGRSTQARAVAHWQLRAGAVALSALTGATEVTVGILLAREGAKPWFDLAAIDALQLAEDADALEDLTERIEAARAGGAPTLRTGSHCTYCPARLSCPAQTSLVRAMASDPAKALPVGLLTREERTATYHRWRLAQSVLDEVKGQLIQAALAEPIEVAPGTLYGPHPATRETLDGQAVADALSLLYGPQVAAIGVELSATKASVGRAVKVEVERRKAAGEKATQAALLRQALAAVEASGGITRETSSRIEEYAGELPPLPGDADAPPLPSPPKQRRLTMVDEAGQVVQQGTVGT